ncbi:MADS-box transcription factor 29 [Triticum aestivum]|uniref:MADS-box transcription factor 29 n=1 Tax=Triticum aestivum TaxID=4565 RepID=UPI001D0307BA|nr:MADS-box transcription factor 29-like [Triticum aestivum]
MGNKQEHAVFQALLRFSQWRHKELSRIVDAVVEPNLVSRTNDGWSDLIERYKGINHGEYLKLLADIATLRHERDHLEASVRRQIVEDLPSGTTAAELRGLEHKLECALGKVRETKVHILEEQNSFLGHMILKVLKHNLCTQPTKC